MALTSQQTPFNVETTKRQRHADTDKKNQQNRLRKNFRFSSIRGFRRPFRAFPAMSAGLKNN